MVFHYLTNHKYLVHHYCLQVVGGVWRTIIPILYQVPFGVGNSMMAGLAYMLRDWRYLQIALSLLSSVYLIIFFILPESPRWLLATGQNEKAIGNFFLFNYLKTSKCIVNFSLLNSISSSSYMFFNIILSSMQLSLKTLQYSMDEMLQLLKIQSTLILVYIIRRKIRK